MAISTYSQLQAAISDWMARSDVSGSAADFITLGEARLNRLLDVVATTTTLTGVVGSRQIDVSSLSIVEPVSLYITDGNEEFLISLQPLGSFAWDTQSGLPTQAAFEGNYIKFERECDQAYSFRFTYQGRFALSDAAPTNEFLTNNPDLYLAASIVWGAAYIKDLPAAAMWKQMLDEFTLEVRSTIAQKKRSMLGVDPALMNVGRWDSDWNGLS
ncbi:hypothetical protein [Sinorhizobium meliloti]|uniref:phage adaptor protein n=1 Tax=Rhizobium meliloti TaxID=382 RepID=UPI000FDA2A1F|nr:hypothetical protein [Sinorhizobium meliloti]RVI91822.1 hypothetical protein CN190_03510 [Sinorhizobium meliloti]